VADILTQQGHSVAVYSVPSVKPLDVELLATAFDRFKLIATVEEHSILGGLGGSVAEWRADSAAPHARLLRFGTRDEFLHHTCDQEEAREYFGLTPGAIAGRIHQSISP